MSSHFECIGLRTPDQESFARIVQVILAKAGDDGPRRGPFRHVRWTDLSGASLRVHLGEGGAIECVTPFFDARGGLSRWRVKTSSSTADAGCQHCGGADCDVLDGAGEMVTRTAVELLNFLPYKEWLKEPRIFDLEVVAFAHQAAFFATEAEFEEGQRREWRQPDGTEPEMPDGRPVRWAQESFAPEGMFGSSEAGITGRASVLFAGHVEFSERLTNALTGDQFQHVRVRTLPGALDTVLDPTTAEGEPASGKIGFIRAWLVGRPAVPPPDTRRRWWKWFSKK